MRMRRTIILLQSTLLLVFSLSSCVFPDYQDIVVSSEDCFPVEQDEEPKESAENPNILATDDVFADLQSTSIDEVQVYYLGEPALVSSSWSGEKTLRLTVTGAEMSKTLEGYDPGDHIPRCVNYDGTRITGDYNFVFINLEVANLSEEQQAFCALALRYYVIRDDGYFQGQGGGAFFFDKAEETSNDYGWYLLEPEETLTAVVGFYVIDGLDLTQGFMPVDLSGVTPTGDLEWFALTERG